MNFNAVKKNVLQEYGMISRDRKTEPISKSKSKKDIMIAKNKKLPQSFTGAHLRQQQLKSPKNEEMKASKKQGQFFQIWQKSSTYTGQQQNNKNDMKKQNLELESKKEKQINCLKSSKHIIIKPQTYFSNRVEAFELRQKLKKSTSMKNLIEQKFIIGLENDKNQHRKTENGQSNDVTKYYDSTKYNWRLSKSKQKLQKQKSLSVLSCKAKLLRDSHKNQPNGNKLTLDKRANPKKQIKLKLKAQQILSYQYYPQNPKQQIIRTQNKFGNHPQNFSYTFGTNLTSSFQFS